MTRPIAPDRAELWADRFSRRQLSTAERSFLAAERRRRGLQILTVEVDTALLLDALEATGFLSPAATPDRAEIEALVRGLLRRWATLATRGAGDPLAHAMPPPTSPTRSRTVPTSTAAPAPDLARDIAALRRALGDLDRPARLAQAERRLRAARAAVDEARAAVRARIAARLETGATGEPDPILARLEAELAAAERAVGPLAVERADLARQAVDALHRQTESVQAQAARILTAALDQLASAAEPLTAVADQCAAYAGSPPRLAALAADITAYVRRARPALERALIRTAEVRFLADIRHGERTFAAGQTYTLPADDAARWVTRGLAQEPALPYRPAATVRVRFTSERWLLEADGSRRRYAAGEEADLAEALALQLIEQGAAIPVDDTIWERLTRAARTLITPPDEPPPAPRGGRARATIT